MVNCEKRNRENEKDENTKYVIKITYGEESLEKCLENMLRAITAKIELDISEF